jgi:hypothetical protein
VVIVDRLFSLPIQVEGFEVNNLHDNQMDLDEGNSGGEHGMEERNAGLGNSDSSQGKGKKSGSSGPSLQDGAPSNDKQVDDMGAVVKHVEGIHASVLAQEEMNSILNAGNSANLNQQLSTVNASTWVHDNHKILARADQENWEAFSTFAPSPTQVATLANEGIEMSSFSCDVNERDIGLHSQLSGTDLQIGNSSVNLIQSTQEVSDISHMFDDDFH